jgi:hypothetical protein
MKKILFTALLLVVISGAAAIIIRAQNSNQMSSDQQQDILKTVQGLVNESNYKLLGFSSADEAKNVRLGNQFAVSIIPLDKLKSFDSTKNKVDDIIAPTPTKLFTLVSSQSNQAISIIETAPKNGKWELINFGNPRLAQAIAAATKGSALRQFNGAIIVRILALRIDLLELNQGTDNPVFISLNDVPRINLRKGEPLSGNELISRVLPVAQHYNGLPL